MGSNRRVGMILLVLATATTSVAAQEGGEARQAYYGAIAEFFRVPASEISILGDWRLPPDEIPVVLFIAGRAGVSAEALAALRRSGSSWHDLAGRYQVSPGAFHLPLPDDAPAGRLEGAYARYREVPPALWSEIQLSDADVVALVNVRLLSGTLRRSVEDVLRRAGSSGSFADLYAQLIRSDRS